MGTKPPYYEDTSITHGICEECLDKETPTYLKDKCPNCSNQDKIKRLGKFRKCPMCMCEWEVEESPKERRR